jgi:hypothetical protein
LPLNRSDVPVTVKEKRSDSDFNLSCGGNKKKVNKMRRGKGRA